MAFIVALIRLVIILPIIAIVYFIMRLRKFWLHSSTIPQTPRQQINKRARRFVDALF